MSDPDWWHMQPGPFDIKRMEAEIERLRAVNKLAVEQNFKDHAEIERLRGLLKSAEHHVYNEGDETLLCFIRDALKDQKA